MDSIPELGRSPGGGHGNPLLYSCLENPMDRGTWQATVHRVTKSPTWLKRLVRAWYTPLWKEDLMPEFYNLKTILLWVDIKNIRWKDWCWSRNSNTFATWCKELTHWKRPQCWERSRARVEGADRGWDGWMASPAQWTWVWANSRR